MHPVKEAIIKKINKNIQVKNDSSEWYPKSPGKIAYINKKSQPRKGIW